MKAKLQKKENNTKQIYSFFIINHQKKKKYLKNGGKPLFHNSVYLFIFAIKRKQL